MAPGPAQHSRSQAEFAQPRVIVRPPAQRPVIFALALLDRRVHHRVRRRGPRGLEGRVLGGQRREFVGDAAEAAEVRLGMLGAGGGLLVGIAASLREEYEHKPW